MTDPLLSITGLTRRYGDHTVLDGVDLDLRAGRAVCLVGPNGSGKSTLLRCVAGADEPTSGSVTYDGAPLDERADRIRAEVAVVMDDLDFFPDLSVVEHLDLVAKAHRTPDAEQVVDDVLNDLRLINQSAQLPSTLSSGQRRRLGLASAFVRPRKLLILDEPEARLDTEGVAWLGERLRADVADGMALLMASHHPDLVAAVGAQVVEL